MLNMYSLCQLLGLKPVNHLDFPPS